VACGTPGVPAERVVLLDGARGVAVLLPFNVTTPLPEALEGTGAPLWKELRRTLEGHDFELKTLALPAARKLWLESIAEARADSPRAGFPEAARVFAARLTPHSDFDVIVSPSLFLQGAPVSGDRARWDGAEQAVALDTGRWQKHVDEDTAFGGAVPALSLHVAVIDAKGALLHQRQAGLVLLSQVRMLGLPEEGMPRFEVVPLDDPLSDPTRLAAGIDRALNPYLPALGGGSRGGS